MKMTVNQWLNEKRAVYIQCIRANDGKGLRDQINEVRIRLNKKNPGKVYSQIKEWVDRQPLSDHFAKELRTIL